MNTFFLIVLLFVSGVGAQEADGPKPDRWRGMVIDESTPEDAIKAFGKPKGDKMSKFRYYILENQLTKKDKLYRHLQFENLDQVDKAILTFDAEKLVAITIDLKDKLAPQAVINSYKIPFEPVINHFAEALSGPGDMKRDQGRLYADRYPSTYYLVGVSERSIVSAMIGNVSFGRILGQATLGTKDQAGTFPGKVMIITLLSRTLENRDGTDVLK